MLLVAMVAMVLVLTYLIGLVEVEVVLDDLLQFSIINLLPIQVLILLLEVLEVLDMEMHPQIKIEVEALGLLILLVLLVFQIKMIE